MRRRIPLLAVLLPLLAGPVVAQDLTIAVRSGPESVDPHFSPTASHASAVRNIFETLVRRSATMEIVPWLATQWRVVDPETWEFDLRPDVKWHDGSPFTAADVKFSIERIPTIASASGGTAAYVKTIQSVEVLGDHKVRFRTKGPAPTLPVDLDRVFMVSQRTPKDADNVTFREGGAAIGTGPYRFVSHVPKSEMVVERWDGWWGPAPHWKKVTFKEIPNDTARVAALLSGSVDLINTTPQASVMTLEKNPDVTLHRTESVFVFLLQPDQREPSPQVSDAAGQPLAANPLRDRRVREAMSISIDRAGIARSVMEGLGFPAHQPMPSSFFGVDPNPTPIPYDPARARALLAEAGYPQGFRIKLNCTNDRLPGDAKVCAALGQMFTRIGLQTEVNALPGAVYLPAFTKGDYSLAMSGFGTLTGEATYMLAQLLHTRDKTPNMGLFNRSRYSNPEIDRLAVAAMTEMDDTKRRDLLRQGMGLAAREHAVIPVAGVQAIWAANAKKVSYTARMDEETLAAEVRPVGR